MIAVFFNLFTNSTCSLLAGLLIVWAFIWFFRIENGPWKLFLLSTPFAKIIFDFARGLPANSILYTGIDPYTLPPGYQAFTISAGFRSLLGPTFNAIFTVRDGLGQIFPASLGDYFMIWVYRTLGPFVPFWILAVVIAVSLLFLIRRIWQVLIFERLLRKDFREAKILGSRDLLLRRVRIYLSHHFSGTPFTGGLFRPYICFPKDAFDQLSAQELEAVIAHELSHVRHFDLVFTALVQILGDLFWFIPGYRSLSRKVDRLREIVADQTAVRFGANPLFLASALLKLKEISDLEMSPNLYSAFFRERSLLKLRVQRLLGENSDRGPRWGWQLAWVRWVIGFWICACVLTATIGGNYLPTSQPTVWRMLENIFV